jgi:hypothetical protein
VTTWTLRLGGEPGAKFVVVAFAVHDVKRSRRPLELPLACPYGATPPQRFPFWIGADVASIQVAARRSRTGPGLCVKHTERRPSGCHREARVKAESACRSRPVDASETLTVAAEREARSVMQHQYAVVRLTAKASLFRVRSVHRFEAHLVVIQEPVQALELALTPHRLGKTQAGVARELARDSFQPLGAPRVAEQCPAILRRDVV